MCEWECVRVWTCGCDARRGNCEEDEEECAMLCCCDGAMALTFVGNACGNVNGDDRFECCCCCRLGDAAAAADVVVVVVIFAAWLPMLPGRFAGGSVDTTGGTW